MTSFPSGCLGKLPLHGDFIRYNAGGAEVHDLDHWVGEGIVHGYNELDAAWDRTFDAAPQARFIYRSPRTQRVIAGLFQPSVDRAGRRYPFLVYAIIEPKALGQDLPYLPWALEPFIARAGEVAGWAESAINLNTFLGHFDSLRFEPDMADARRNFGRYVLSTAAADFWARSFGAADDPRVYAAVQSVSEGPESRTPFALRLPITDGAAEAGFWLELTRRLTRAGSLPTLAWFTQPKDGSGHLHLCFGELGARFFLPVLLPGRSDPVIRDLAGARGDSEASQRGRATFQSALAAPSLKLSDLLQRLPRCKGL